MFLEILRMLKMNDRRISHSNTGDLALSSHRKRIGEKIKSPPPSKKKADELGYKKSERREWDEQMKVKKIQKLVVNEYYV